MGDELAGCLLIFILGIFAVGFIGLSIYDEATCEDSVELIETYTTTECGPGGKGSIVKIDGYQYFQCECPREPAQ